MIDLTSTLDGVEWWDNHRIDTINTCKRKALLHYIFSSDNSPDGTGLATSVGEGADFGTAMHAAHAVYYALWGKAEEETRRALAIQKFIQVHGKYFWYIDDENQRQPRQPRKNNHTIDNGVKMLDVFYDRMIAEDMYWRPLETELIMIVIIKPRPHETFEPIVYVAPVDGMMERTRDKALYVHEFKHVAGVDREVAHLKISRQLSGYIYAAREWYENVDGALISVLGTAITKEEYRRDLVNRTPQMIESWRNQTIQIVTEWRVLEREFRARLKNEGRDLNLAAAMDRFVQHTNSCMDYGQCTFYDICLYGLGKTQGWGKNEWNPLKRGV